MSALLPCPFCGGEAFMERWMPDNDGRIYCQCCVASQPVTPQQSDASAIAAWNRRAPGVVKDCLTTGYAAGAEAMRERAAAEIDCGCSWRDAALAATNKGERFVACGNDPCGAIEARAIRALPIPEPAAALKARA